MTTSAERMRRCRQRRSDGAVLVRLLLNPDGIADLIALGWLLPGASAQETREALARMMNTALDARVRPQVRNSHTSAAIGALVDILGNEPSPPAARVAAAHALLDRGWGKPIQPIDSNQPALGITFVLEA